jgi:LmbE family N-acetylglucosaminyl deacetylase
MKLRSIAKHRSMALAISSAMVAALAASAGLLRVSGASAATCSATTVNIVAHEDDDLLFLNPDVQADIDASRCVRTVYVTAGDGGDDSGYYFLGRENGERAAYAQMARVANVWNESTANVSVGGKVFPLRTVTLSGNDRVSLMFLRLPDGNIDGNGFAASGFVSIEKLQSGAISSIAARDGSATYSYSELVGALTAVVNGMRPDTLRIQNFLGTPGNGDHSDHLSVAKLAAQASTAAIPVHTVVGYEDYAIAYYSVNLSKAQTTKKQNTLLSYAKFDPGVCQTATACNQNEFGQYFKRRYVIGSFPSGGVVTTSTTTIVPTTIAPTTAAPTTIAPTTTAAPTTTSAPTTSTTSTILTSTTSTTAAPVPTTMQPTTSSSTTTIVSTTAPSTTIPSTTTPSTTTSTPTSTTTASTTSVASTTTIGVTPTTTAPTTTTTSTTIPTYDATCRVKFVREWDAGTAFGAAIYLTNLGPSLIDWKLQWQVPSNQEVTNGYSAIVSKSSPGMMQATPEFWTANLPANGTIGFGYSVDDSSTRDTPKFALNGKPCLAG